MSTLSGNYRYVGDEMCYEVCPVCGDTDWNFYINPRTGKWFCFDGKHYRGGSMEMPISEDEDGSVCSSLLELLQPPQSKYVPGDISLPQFTTLSNEAASYLFARGVDYTAQKKLGLVEEVNERRIVFPFFHNGLLTYWVSRLYDPYGRGPKYKYPTGIPRQLYYLPRETTILVIVEGVMDAIAVWQAGYPVIALGGKILSADCRRQLDQIISTGAFRAVGVMLDYDALAETLELVEYGEVRWPKVFPVVCTAKDPGEMGVDEIVHAVHGRVPTDGSKKTK